MIRKPFSGPDPVKHDAPYDLDPDYNGENNEEEEEGQFGNPDFEYENWVNEQLGEEEEDE